MSLADHALFRIDEKLTGGNSAHLFSYPNSLRLAKKINIRQTDWIKNWRLNKAWPLTARKHIPTNDIKGLRYRFEGSWADYYNGIFWQR